MTFVSQGNTNATLKPDKEPDDMTISPELAAVAHAAAKLATARINSDRLGKKFDVVSDYYRDAKAESAHAWAEYEAACNAFVASLAG